MAWSTILLVTVLLPLIGLSQPETLWLAWRNVVIVDLFAVLALALNAKGWTRTASILFVAAFVLLVTYNAPTAGGIRSPGVQAYFLFVMLAGVLMGERAGLLTALACALLGLGLVLLEQAGVAPRREVTYAPFALWILTCAYIGLAFFTMRLATASVRRALDRVQAELAERRKAETRLERALDAGRIGVFDHDLTSPVFRGDARALELMGLTADAEGNTAFDAWLALVHPDDRDRVFTDLGLIAGGQPQGRSLYRLTRPDGQLRYMEVAAHRTLGADGKPEAIFGMLIDVTERKTEEAERERLLGDLGERVKELRLLHEVARLLQKSSNIDRLLLEDLVNRLPAAWLHASDAAARITFRDHDVTSRGWRDSEWRLRSTFKTSVGPGAIEVAYRSPHLPAHEGPFLAEERALIDSIAEMLGSHIERHTAERQRQGLEAQLRQGQKMDALGTLAGGIAHDFNNILTAIGGNAQLAAVEAGKGTPLAEHVQEILKAHERARDLVRRILLFSRREEAERTVQPLAPVVKEVLQLLRASLPPNVEIREEITANLPAVSADTTQIHQVLMNLGTNAGYAMRERGGRLTVSLDAVTVNDEASAPSAELEPGPFVRLRVADTGSGMSREVRERLFEPFFTTKGNAGTGLGLSVVHGIIRDHGGAITVESEVGVGTRFEVYLPAAEAAAARRNTPVATLVRGNGEHVMYVDDEPSLCLVVSRTLIHLGYRCSDFTDATAALQEFRTAPSSFDAVITDLQMPGMSGLDLVRAVRKIRPEIPLAVASGYAADRLEDPDAGTVAWITKPSTLAEMASAVHRLVAKS